MKTKVPYGMKDYTIHGTELEPFHIYHQIYEHGGLQVPFHWHKEMEWIWVEKGSLELTLGTQRKILQKQDFVMINSYELHQLRRSATHLRFIMPWCFCRICLLFPIRIIARFLI